MYRSTVIWLGLSLSLFPLWAAPRIELVQSVPLETNLAVPDIRDTADVWLEMIRGARLSIDLEQFYVSEQAGEALTPVLQAIHAAGKRGVRVRLLVDSKFFKTYPDSVTHIGSIENCEARIIDFSKYGGVQHSKYFVVDGKSSFVGSHNFDWRALSHIHEIGVRVDDSDVASQLAKIFEKDWAEGVQVRTPSFGGVGLPSLVDTLVARTGGVTVVAAPQAANPSGVEYSLKAIEELIDSSRRSVRIQVMEYSTKGARGNSLGSWKQLDNTIRRAAQRGVQVELLVDISNVKKAKADLKALAAVKNVQVKTVTIPPWSGGAIPYARLIHSKYLLVDGARSWIGNENWSQGYFVQTRDVGVVTSDGDIATKLGQVFETLWGSPYSARL